MKGGAFTFIFNKKGHKTIISTTTNVKQLLNKRNKNNKAYIVVRVQEEGYIIKCPDLFLTWFPQIAKSWDTHCRICFYPYLHRLLEIYDGLNVNIILENLFLLYIASNVIVEYNMPFPHYSNSK